MDSGIWGITAKMFLHPFTSKFTVSLNLKKMGYMALQKDGIKNNHCIMQYPFTSKFTVNCKKLASQKRWDN
jgi:hypothetical protein